MTHDEMILPHFFLFLSDETDYWLDEELVERCGGSILGAYLFNANRHVHCCELTPSYEMEFLGSIPGNPKPHSEQEVDRIDMDLVDGDQGSDPISYVHVSSVNLTKCTDVWKLDGREWQEILDDADDDKERAHSAAVELARECIQH